MSKEKGEELFRALNIILDAVSSLNLRDLEAEARADRGESSSKAAAESSKGKDKVAEPDWEDIPFNPVPITPLSSRPRFTQVVGSSWEAMASPHVGGPFGSPRRSPSPSRSPSHSDAMAVALAALNMAAARTSNPWRTTRRPSSWECGTTAPPTWLVRTLNNKPSPAPQLWRSSWRQWSR